MSDHAIAFAARQLFTALEARATTAANYMQQLEQSAEWPGMRQSLREFALAKRARYEAMPPCLPPAGGGIKVLKNTGSEATVQTGNTTMGFQKTNQGLSITDSKGNVTQVWGDPHYVDPDGKSVDIHGDTISRLPSGAQVFVKTANIKGERENDPNAATYAHSVGVINPDGTAFFVDGLTGDKPLEISIPPQGQLPQDFIHEMMGGDFKPEAYLAVNGRGQWTDLNGLPLTQQSANQMRDDSRSQRAAAANLASACFENGLYPRSIWNSQGFDPGVRNAQWYGGLSQTQNMFEQQMCGNIMSRMAMMGPLGNVMMQIMGAGCDFGGGFDDDMGMGMGMDDGYGSMLPMLQDPRLLAAMMGGGRSGPVNHPGEAAAVLADHVGSGAIDLAGLRALASSAQGDPRVKDAARFFVEDHDRRGNQSYWRQIETSDVRGADDLSAGKNFRRFADRHGFAGEHPLSTPYQPPMPQVFMESLVRELLSMASQRCHGRGELPQPGQGQIMPMLLRAY